MTLRFNICLFDVKRFEDNYRAKRLLLSIFPFGELYSNVIRLCQEIKLCYANDTKCARTDLAKLQNKSSHVMRNSACAIC